MKSKKTTAKQTKKSKSKTSAAIASSSKSTTNTTNISKSQEGERGGGRNAKTKVTTKAATYDTIVPIPIDTPIVSNNNKVKLHANLDEHEFYRHVDPQLPGPIKMKNLIVWCGQRAIEKQKSQENSSEKHILSIAKVVQEEILSKLMNGNINISWYHRKDKYAKEPPKQQHPRNIQNENRLKDYEETIANLRAEDQLWTKLAHTVNSLHASVVDTCAATPSGESLHAMVLDNADTLISSSLSEGEKKYLDHLGSEDYIDLTKDEDNERPIMDKFCSEFRIQIDEFYQLLYKAHVFDDATQDYCEDVLVRLRNTLKKRDEGGRIKGIS
ncbi:4908_t:CDS:2 [Ambispora gerdemannii]|uniref:4908_t:CDS:1 n=1 Tax=Ambispora gerdemannii TaxID=144530 RepID=A0A9N9FLN6_9GLOM|nr:4908_t:CDS:2 [Ambispora gerdemannii]